MKPKTMSRDGRKILDAYCGLVGVATTIDDVFMAEGLAHGYYPNPAISVMRTIHKRTQTEGGMGLAYFRHPILSMIKDSGVRGDFWGLTEGEKRNYWYISNAYLLEDFNYDRLVNLRVVCGHPYDRVQRAVQVGKSEEVFSVAYVLRVVEADATRQEYQTHVVDKRRELFASGRPDDIKIAWDAEKLNILTQCWEELSQNKDLENKMRKWLGGRQHG